MLAAEGGGFHAPGLGEFFPETFLFEGTPFAMNRITLVRLAAALLLTLFFVGAARNPKLVPSKLQSLGEMALEFVRQSIAIEVLGEKFGRRFAPLLAFLFWAVFFLNITGVIPFLNIAGSSVIGIPLLLALVAYVAFIYAGVKQHGFGHYFKSQLMPAGVPKVMYVLLIPIEFFSNFIVRPATLTIRLLANMLAGHMLLVMCFAATNYLFFEATGAMKAAGALTLAGGLLMTLFEVFVAALQAYIFAILTAVYIQMSVEDH